MADDDSYKPSTGRFARLAKLATLSAKLSTDVVSRGVRRLRGEEGESLMGAGAAEKLVATLGELKGLAMKVGQQLSMDPDLLTPEVRAVIARLQNQAPPMPWATVRQVLTQELGRPPEEAFAEVSEAPLASASLGQVHRAVAKDGTPLAVKVQYPGIAQALLADLENLGAMVSVVAASTRMLHGKAYFAEVREGMLDELDYREEAKRLTQFARAAAPLADLKVPRVYDALTSARVLTLELLHGQTLKDFMQGLPGHPTEERFRAARLLTRAIWGPFLLTGLIHADPHPGNFMLLDDGRLGVLDFGAIKQLSEPWRRVNTTLFEAAVKDLPYDAVALSLESGFTFDRPEEVRDFIEQVVQIAIRAARSPHFDYAQAGTNRLLRNHFLQHPTKVAAIRPPREAVQFFRAIGGLGQNLENLGAAGDFRAVHEELLALLPKR